MREECFTTVKKMSEFTRICVEIHSTVTWWQELLFLYKFF